jgi:hypothetical protein
MEIRLNQGQTSTFMGESFQRYYQTQLNLLDMTIASLELQRKRGIQQECTFHRKMV